MDRTQVKSITGLLSRAAGLVFFAFLAISLGVIFGYLFEDWVKEQPGAAVQGPVDTNLDYPLTVDDTGNPQTETVQEPSGVAPIAPVLTVRYKVKVGPFSSRDSALKSADRLETAGYPIYVSTSAPFTVQVGAFSSQANADRLKSQLAKGGYTAFVQQE